MFYIKVSRQNELFSNSAKDFNKHFFRDFVPRWTIYCADIGFFIIICNRDYHRLEVFLTNFLLQKMLDGPLDQYGSPTPCSTTRVCGPISLISCNFTVVFVCEMCL